MKVLVSYKIPWVQELAEEEWLRQKFGKKVWIAMTTDTVIGTVTVALSKKDATYIVLFKETCPTPKVWQNVFTDGRVK